jgi:hypothetical protein
VLTGAVVIAVAIDQMMWYATKLCRHVGKALMLTKCASAAVLAGLEQCTLAVGPHILIYVSCMGRYVDVAAWVLTGRFPIGVAKYLTWPETSWARRLTSTHHVWFMPFCIAVMRVSTLSRRQT